MVAHSLFHNILVQIGKKEVEDYWHSSHKRRKWADTPCVVFTASNERQTQEYTHFSISLRGSQSQMEHKSIVFEVPPFHLQPHPSFQQPHPPPHPPLHPQLEPIKIICNMYEPGSPIIEALFGRHDCSVTILSMDDVNCCTLLCEISFHLWQWEALGHHLGLEAHDIEKVKCQHSTYFFEYSFRMLATWLSGNPNCNLQQLINGLHSIRQSLQVVKWTSLYSLPKHMKDIFVLKLANLIQCHWKFVARLLGLSIEIDAIVQRDLNNLSEQAVQMIHKWVSCGGSSAKLFDSVHCIHEHVHYNALENALKLFM